MLSDWERMRKNSLKEQIKECDKTLKLIDTIKVTDKNTSEIKYQKKYWSTKKKNLEKELKEKV